MRRDLHDRRVLLTGAWSGIGRALSLQLARAGARLLVTARSAEPLEALARELKPSGVEVITLAGDVTEPTHREQLAAMVGERWGALDILINNAGVEASGLFTSSSEATLRQLMEVNFFAPVELLRLCVPLLERGRQPVVVNVSSRCGRRGLPDWAEYSASKFALTGFTEAMRAELACYDITALLVSPGFTITPLREHALRCDTRVKTRERRGMSPEHVARKILHTIQTNRTERTVGLGARWLLRGNRFFPRWIDGIFARKHKRLYPPNYEDNP